MSRQRKTPAKRIPITAAAVIADQYGMDQVIVLAWARGAATHVVTYGRTIADCEQAAAGGNRMKRVMGWPDELCQAQPARARRQHENLAQRVRERRLELLALPAPRSECPGCFSAIYEDAARAGWCTDCVPNAARYGAVLPR